MNALKNTSRLLRGQALASSRIVSGPALQSVPRPMLRLLPRVSQPSFLLSRATFVSSASNLERVKGGQPTDGERQITELLTAKFKPKTLQVADISGGCGSFYAITLTSKEFKGLSTIKQHRLVNQELKEIITGIHGLQLRTQAEE
ncbi:hypothetical protein OC846_005706 [Tilletia horrida]|uniref:Bola-like protein n=1 Tax=Tilletia horrida TaxID=155126 RepID=A0AAN6JPN2_9BASI|nr:hypothetical protein OC845_005848 [Tilletia horrida]KAK0545360.1 hypothetical protein OC846_005706 [Tilletia horrida]KAK0561303.1 hypothetical protein OC861_005882 [Tilletia horrida]